MAVHTQKSLKCLRFTKSKQTRVNSMCSIYVQLTENLSFVKTLN